MIFAPPHPHTQRDRGHERIVTRTIRTSTLLNDSSTSPRAGIQNRNVHHDLNGENRSHDVASGITNLTTDETDPKRLLRLVRGHWNNSLFWVRDVTY